MNALSVIISGGIMTKFLIDYSLFNKLINDDFASGVYILGAKLFEKPKENKEEGGGIVSRRLRQLNKEKVVKKKEDNTYLIMSAEPVSVVPNKLFLSVDKSQLEQVLNNFNNDLRFIGVTYFDLRSFKSKLEDDNDYKTITNPAVKLMLSELVKSINGFNDKIILVKEDDKLYALSSDAKVEVIPYKLPRELTPYEKFFTLDSVDEEEFNEFFSFNGDLKEFNEFFNNNNY